ncbi:MAG: DPP IV N-terminal domain-containing protein [Fimbriimonadaceae bacterium]|nr:DPP IV N-terminal domain-containing protein [Fimbriimonadaceae bacterium]
MLVALLVPFVAFSQDSAVDMNRYQAMAQFQRTVSQAWVSGRVSVAWHEDGKRAFFRQGSKTYVVDLAHYEVRETSEPMPSARRRGSGAPDRGRQFRVATSPDGNWSAECKDRNVFLTEVKSKESRAVTTDGSVSERIKNGEASWVYGEELGVREAMWFSPDSKHLAYYRFDERPVRDFYLGMKQSEFYVDLDTEAYPKAGTANPKVELWVAPVTGGDPVKIPADFGDASLAEYVYGVEWSPGGNELTFFRTNRKQNRVQWVAVRPDGSNPRVIAEELHPESWAENSPEHRWSTDGARVLWATERNGFKNYDLIDTKTGRRTPVTQNPYDHVRVLRWDEAGQRLWTVAFAATEPYREQVVLTDLRTGKQTLLTDPSLHHTATISPDGEHIFVTSQQLDVPPTSSLLRADGSRRAVVAKSDTSRLAELKIPARKVFQYLAADAKTTLYGTYQLPRNFDPGRKYPVILDVYAGPESGGLNVSYAPADARTELGFITVSLAGRGTNGRGKAFRDAVYGKLGVVEIDDQAAGIRELAKLPFVDGKRVGINGTSYGGYASIMAVLRHPDVFRSACASASVTDWRHYDTIYTERYQGLPGETENKSGYDAGSAMTHVRLLKGHLMLFYGTADNNVHPNNTLMLVKALDAANKRYELQVGPDEGHTAISGQKMLEFFVRTLIDAPNVRPQARRPSLGRKGKTVA